MFERMIYLNLNDTILSKVLLIPAILIGLTIHEFAHAFIADRLGDKTPKFQGRLTLNPFVHIDLVGFVTILIIGFGWAKPIETNPSAYKNKYKDDIKVSVAGVVANFITALIFAFLTAFLVKISFVTVDSASNLQGILGSMLIMVVNINCMLCIFNLLPIPGLDGFHILRDLFPKFFYKISDFMYRYQLIILLVFVMTPAASILVGTPYNLLFNAFLRLGFSAFGLM